MIKSIGIIQVRLSSKRLPKKALIKLGDKTLIGHMFYRAKKIDNLSKIVCATSSQSENDLIEEEAKRYGIDVYRGSEKNVISRFFRNSRYIQSKVYFKIDG